LFTDKKFKFSTREKEVEKLKKKLKISENLNFKKNRLNQIKKIPPLFKKLTLF
jgi:hypothetical protein